MAETQSCYVCGRWETLVDSRLQVSANKQFPLGVVAQCPYCFRFICSEHGEKLNLSGSLPWWKFWDKGNAVLTICCPFDPGIPLGDDSN